MVVVGVTVAMGTSIRSRLLVEGNRKKDDGGRRKEWTMTYSIVSVPIVSNDKNMVKKLVKNP